MVSNTLNPFGKLGALVSNKVGENLDRLESSGKYYGLLKRAGKQFRHSLNITDRKLAQRRLPNSASTLSSNCSLRLESPSPSVTSHRPALAAQLDMRPVHLGWWLRTLATGRHVLSRRR